MDILKRAWKGQEKLWKVFWIYGVLGFIVLIGLSVGLTIMAAFIGIALVAKLTTIIATLLTFLFEIWWMVSTWRCAWNAKSKVWGYAARVAVLLVLGGLLFNLVNYIREQSAPAPAAMMQQAPAPVATIPVAPAPVAAPAPDACEQRMIDHALKNNADPATYIAQNQAYLQQCRQQLQSQP